MDLRQYIKKEGLFIKDFSEMVNYDRTTIQKVMTGERKPGRKLINAIIAATNGEVTKEDILKLLKDNNASEN